jgi:hypothetical protein
VTSEASTLAPSEEPRLNLSRFEPKTEREWELAKALMRAWDETKFLEERLACRARELEAVGQKLRAADETNALVRGVAVTALSALSDVMPFVSQAGPSVASMLATFGDGREEPLDGFILKPGDSIDAPLFVLRRA